MVKRFIDSTLEDIRGMSSKDLIDSIKASEGRVIMAELLATAQPLIYGVSNAELVSAFGADLIVLNFYDVNNPVLYGLVPSGDGVIRSVKGLTGRPVGINLEPVSPEAKVLGIRDELPEGRLGTVENAVKAKEQGADFIVLTGNPRTGVTNESIIEAARSIKAELGDDIILMAGKMHAAGMMKESGSRIISREVIDALAVTGCDCIMVPSPGTVPGITLECVHKSVEYIHSLGIMAMSAIGTSQEGSDEETIKQIALYNKMVGVDIHHIGDSGYTGVAVPENIMVYSIAIRGKKHTFFRIAKR
ncbi:MAG: hypothetical protein QME46_03120 [Thermoanaerobacteraceae bacterium]|nr:hypothetical protein [Thermoanaerobacteraceae bacterium]